MRTAQSAYFWFTTCSLILSPNLGSKQPNKAYLVAPENGQGVELVPRLEMIGLEAINELEFQIVANTGVIEDRLQLVDDIGDANAD